MALLLLSPLAWVTSTELVRMLYAGSVPGLEERVFRSRAEFDLDFYLGATFRYRLALTVGIALVGGVCFRSFRRCMRAVAQSSPRSTIGQTFSAAALGMLASFASGYKVIPGLGNDVVTYIVVARRHFDDSYLVGDLPIRDVDGSSALWALVVRALSAVVGFEGAFFAISLIGGAIISIALFRLVANTLGAGSRAALFAAAVGLTVTYGRFGYSLSVPSHGDFAPTPRYLAVGLSALAISLILERALIKGVLLGLAAATMNALDGLVSVGIALVVVLAISCTSGERTLNAMRNSRVALSLSGLLLVIVLLGLEGPSEVKGYVGLVFSDPLMIVGVGAVISLLTFVFSGNISLVAPHKRPREVVALTAFTIGALVAALQRRPRAVGATFDSMAVYETLLSARVAESMILLSKATPLASLILVALSLLAVGALQASNRIRLGASEASVRYVAAVQVAAVSVVTTVFIAVGSILLEEASVPGLVTIWPIRVAWLVVFSCVGIVAFSLSSKIDQIRLGVVPVLAIAALLLSGPSYGRQTWAVMGTLIVILLLLRSGDSEGHKSAIHDDQVPGLGVGYGVASLIVIALFAVTVQAPEIRFTTSLERLSGDGSPTSEVVELALAAQRLTPPESRVLVPPNFEWGAFRLISERGVAFEFKAFSTAQPASWYEQLRWMCDPLYRMSENEDFAIGTAEIEDCFAQLDLAALLRVAEVFEADFAVVRSEVVSKERVLAASSSQRFALIRVE